MKLADLHLPHGHAPDPASPHPHHPHQPLYRSLGGIEEKAGNAFGTLIIAALVIALVYGVVIGVGHPAYFDRLFAQLHH